MPKPSSSTHARFIRFFDSVGHEDVSRVGGKNASLGEMIRHLAAAGIRVPNGFAVTAEAYRLFVQRNGLDREIRTRLPTGWNQDEVRQVGPAIRERFRQGEMPDEIAAAVREAYAALCAQYAEGDQLAVACRSSATAEDLPEASFAGQQESYLNVRGADAVVQAVKDCFASLFTNRAIIYRENNNFEHLKVALSVGVQKMVRADKGAAGVLFTIDTETGFPDVVVINAAWGLGESVVQGTVNPDEYRVFKPLLDQPAHVPILDKIAGDKEAMMVYAADAHQFEPAPPVHAERNGKTNANGNGNGNGNGAVSGGETLFVRTPAEKRRAYTLDDTQIVQLARWAAAIERHYRRPMDVEWALDGVDGQLYIVQARPETVQSRIGAGTLKSYERLEDGDELLQGLAIGEAIATGRCRVLADAEHGEDFQFGDILVTTITTPDWVPLMKKAAAIVTDSGGRTSHAAIVSRELGIPAVVGTGSATTTLRDGQPITVSCAEGATGKVFAGTLRYRATDIDLDSIPKTQTAIMLNIASPAASERWWKLPADGIGLARIEFAINEYVKVHPMALLRFDQLDDERAKQQIAELTAAWDDKGRYFVDKLAWAIARIAAPQWPKAVIVRLSDFKTNEYAELLGGRQFEQLREENPMLGFRGASRYYHERYRDAFALECQALKRVREEIGLTNVIPMLPFVRTVTEADEVLALMAHNGLTRGDNGLQVYMMCEVPSNVIMAEAFAERFDGFSIGSNDLTQLVLGVDRDSQLLSKMFDERDEAVKEAVAEAIRKAHNAGIKIGICGQAPSDYPDFAAFLVECGIDSMSLNPDSVVTIKQRVAEIEAELGRPSARGKTARDTASRRGGTRQRQTPA